MLTSLGRHSTLVGQHIDPFYDHVCKFAFHQKIPKGQAVGNTICPVKRFSNLIILTSGASKTIGFCNEAHDDKRDWFEECVNEDITHFFHKIYEDIAALENSENQTNNIQLPLLQMMHNHLKSLKSLSPKGSFEKATVCGYKFLGSWKGQDLATSVLYSFFVHTALGIAVSLESDIYHWFRAGQHRHQTALSVIWDKSLDTITFNDSSFQILAWGSGSGGSTKSGKRREFYLRHFENVARVTQPLFLRMVNANPAIRAQAVQEGLMSQDGEII